MLKEYYHDIDMNANQLFNSRLHNITTAARVILGGTLSTSDKGYMVYDTDLSSPYFWNGTQWLAAGGGGAVWGGITGTLTAQTDLTAYLSTNYYPLSSNPASYIDLTDLSSGTGISYSNTTGVITNSAPDQTVVLNNGTGISVTGTYPNFTITNTSPSSGGTVTSVGASSPLSSTGGSTPSISIQQANVSQGGYLSSGDWTTFNGKVGGNGTQNYVPKWSVTGSTLTDSQIFDNGSYVAIGTSTIGAGVTATSNFGTNKEIYAYGGFNVGSVGSSSYIQTGMYRGLVGNTVDFWAGNAKLGILSYIGGGLGDTFTIQDAYNTGFATGVVNAFKINGVIGNTTVANTVEYNQVNISPSYSQLSPLGVPLGTGKIRGIYYNPSVGNINGSTHIAYQNTSGDIIHGNLATSGADEMVTVDSTGKLKKQVIPTGTGTVTSIATSGLISGGNPTAITTTGTISTSMATGKLVGRYSAGTGVMEEISVGSGLTLTGAGVLNNTATPTPLGYYGAWQDNNTQTAAASNTGYPMIFGAMDLENQVRVVVNGSGDKTRITFDNAGIYNFQFSSQFQNIGNSDADVTIWLRKFGSDVSGSAGLAQVAKRLSAGAGNEGHTIVSWNYLLSVAAGDYYELIWSTSNHTDVSMQAYAAGSPPPSVPSVILTVTQQSGIMAGTGITGLGTSGNLQTGANQTLATGTTGTDFNIVSSGNIQTFNIPSASASNRGLVTTGAQTLAGAKTFSTAPILSSLTASQLLALDSSNNIQSLTTATYPTLTELSYVKGVTSAIQTQINNKGYSINIGNLGATFSASVPYYFGIPGVTTTGTAAIRRVYIPQSGTIKSAYYYMRTTSATSNENWTISIRLNNNVGNTTTLATVGNTSQDKVFSNTGLNISVNAGDYIEIITTTPAWVTPPGTTFGYGTIFIQ